MEKLFRIFLMNWALVKKEDLKKILFEANLNSVPHVKLRTRRKGKRVLYKVNFLEKEESLQKGLLAFSKNLKENKGVNFLNSLEKELENLSLGKSALITKRDEIHRLALENAPFSWTAKSLEAGKK